MRRDGGMVLIQIWEGLGNQLFQYAYGRAVQEKGRDVRLVVGMDGRSRTPRTYLLDKFRITIKRAYWAEYLVAPLVNRGMFLQTGKPYIYKEEDVAYKPELIDVCGGCYMKGWFQNERYFSGIEEKLRREIYPKENICIPRELRRILSSENTVSVHVRRGDFIEEHNVLNKVYYKRAMGLAEEMMDDLTYCVFSDDLAWVRSNMNFGRDAYFVNADGKLKDYEELIVMSRCRHHIIANSTFSWWGAWLNKDPRKVVIGPKIWFSTSRTNIMPRGWIRI